MINKKNMSSNDVEIKSCETVYKGYFTIKKYQLRFRLFSGAWSNEVERELFERGNSVAVLLYDPQLDKVVLTQQFRIGALKDENSPWLIELVAGIIEKDEPSENAAKREVKEETGLSIKQVFPIYNYWVSPGGASEKVTLYCAIVKANFAEEVYGLQHEEENIKVILMKTQKSFLAIKKGKINNAHTIIALQWLQINRKKLRKNIS